MPARPANHRLKAREDLSRAAALAEEGRTPAARKSLLSAADHAIDAVIESESVQAPTRLRAVTILALRGVVPFDPRPLLGELRSACDPETAGADEAAQVRLQAAILAVQALVDSAAAIPSPSRTPGAGRCGTRPSSTDEDPAPGGLALGEPRRDAPPAPPAARPRKRLAPMLATGLCALGGRQPGQCVAASRDPDHGAAPVQGQARLLLFGLLGGPSA